MVDAEKISRRSVNKISSAGERAPECGEFNSVPRAARQLRGAAARRRAGDCVGALINGHIRSNGAKFERPRRGLGY